MKQLLVGSNNKGKLKEIRALLDNVNVRLLTPDELHLNLHVEEDGKTYVSNAEKKAIAFARASGLVSLADDSGLEVDALHGAPGLHSARYLVKPGATDADRRAYLLQNLKEKPRPWTARFRATVAIALPNGSVQFAEGQCEGEIMPEERGTGGFGYDPIFLIPELNRTMAELSMNEKNRLSHRARAIINARPILYSIFDLE